MNEIAKTSREMISRTGLRLKEFADRAGVSESLIAKLVSGNKPTPPKPSTAITLIRTAIRSGLVDDDSVADFARACGIELPPVAAMNINVLAPAIRQNGAIRALCEKLPPDEATAVWWLFDLIDHSSPAIVLRAMESVAKMAGISLSPTVSASKPRTLDVKSSPVQRPGYVEQIVTTYEVQPPLPRLPKTSKKRRGAI